MLKSAAPIIASFIARLINYSFSKSVFPQRWKTAKVFPLFKGGDLENVNNYRPISVLPVLSKVIERHVHDTLHSCLCDNNLILLCFRVHRRVNTHTQDGGVKQQDC